MQEPDLRIKAKKASSNDLTATSKLRVKTHIDNVIYFSSSAVSFVSSTYSIIIHAYHGYVCVCYKLKLA